VWFKSPVCVTLSFSCTVNMHSMQAGGVLCTLNPIGLIIVSFCKCYILKISLAINETIFGACFD